MTRLIALLIFFSLASSFGRGAAAEEACFEHNGSVMHLSEAGGRFTISYIDPRPVLRRAGVEPGTVLVHGTATGGGFTGHARRFSRHCIGRPLVYPVSGYFETETVLVFMGRRPIYERCRPTGRVVDDELVFTYAGQNC